MNWVSILGKISVWIILLPLLIGMVGFHKLNKDSKLIFVIVVIGVIPQVLNPFFKGTTILTTLYNLYTPLEFFIYWLLFYSRISIRKLKTIAILILFLFSIVSVYLFLKNDLTNQFLTVWVIINNIFQLLLVGVCLLNFYYTEGDVLSHEEPLFWYIIGIILYASCTVVFYNLWNYLKDNKDSAISILNLIHHVFNILLYLLFSGGFILNIYKNKKEVLNE